MFASRAQLHTAIWKLLKHVNGARFWAVDGPTDEAVLAIDAITENKTERPYLSSGQEVLLRAAFDIFNGRGNATIYSALRVLDDRNQRALWSLLLAMVDGPEAIQRWIDQDATTQKKKD